MTHTCQPVPFFVLRMLGRILAQPLKDLTRKDMSYQGSVLDFEKRLENQFQNSSLSPTPLNPSGVPAADVSLEQVPIASALNMGADSAVVPSLLSSVTTADEPPAITVTRDGMTFCQIKPAKQSTPETDSDKMLSLQPPLISVTVATAHLNENTLTSKNHTMIILNKVSDYNTFLLHRTTAFQAVLNCLLML